MQWALALVATAVGCPERNWHVPCGSVSSGDGSLVFITDDWHTTLLPVCLKAYIREQGLMNYTRLVLVIHNIGH